MVRTGLCLSGGGGKGAFEWGALQYVAEHPHLYPDGFARGEGTSVGAIHMGGLVQFAPGPDQIPAFVAYMGDCWGKLRGTQDVWKLRFPPYLAGLWQPSIGDNTPLRKLLTSLIDFKRVKSGTPCEIAAWDLLSGRGLHYDLQDAQSIEELVSLILASSSFPLAFPPEEVTGAYCTDGGIFDIAPVGRLIDNGCDHILAILCRNPDVPEPKTRADFKSTLSVGLRCLDGMESEIVRGDLERVRLWNYAIEAGHPRAAGKRKIVLDVIVPHESLGDPLDFSPVLTERRRKAGYESARRYFEGDGER